MSAPDALLDLPTSPELVMLLGPATSPELPMLLEVAKPDLQ